jgi:anti-sigma-K factor RskA
MMTLPDDATLARYVLGTLPAGEAERFDELSIADTEFADRVRAIERRFHVGLTPQERADLLAFLRAL